MMAYDCEVNAPSGRKATYEFNKNVSFVDVVENGNLEGEPSNNWSSFWVLEWRTMDERFFGPANIVVDPTDADNHCIKVVVRSEEEARAAGNMMADSYGNYAAWESVFFVQSKQKFESDKVLRLTMRVKADRRAVIQTQAHRTPDEYNYWRMFGDIEVTDTWQTVVKEVVLTPDMTQETNGEGMRTVAFLLATVPEGNVFYFDDIKLEYESTILKGDLNSDGKVDIYDVTALIDIILYGDTTEPYIYPQYDHVAADVNEDDGINIYDVTLLIDLILEKE
ncbi:MAG: dockerin type I repeat-containing protein [Prevotella sp.]|nr:dockerin type I repeat-containing protein [Prevotella sp.]